MSLSAGITYVVGAGNDNEDIHNSIPAAFDEVIAVSALADFDGQAGGGAPQTCRTDFPNVDDTFASFSNFGAGIDLVAPGMCIRTTQKGGGYDDTVTGTSIAAPFVTGAAALYIAAHPGASPDQVRSGLRAAAFAEDDGLPYWIGDPDLLKEPLVSIRGF